VVRDELNRARLPSLPRLAAGGGRRALAAGLAVRAHVERHGVVAVAAPVLRAAAVALRPPGRGLLELCALRTRAPDRVTFSGGATHCRFHLARAAFCGAG